MIPIRYKKTDKEAKSIEDLLFKIHGIKVKDDVVSAIIKKFRGDPPIIN